MKEKHYLSPLLEPKSVGVIGASERESSLGNVVVRNMLNAGFRGRLFAVNPKHEAVLGVPCYKSVEDVPHRLDLVVIAVRADRVLSIVESCGRAGVKAIIIMSAGFSETGPRGALLERHVVEAARRYRIRLLGPNCLGIMRPVLGLNATFAHVSAIKGTIGLISQSGALCTSILDWAEPNKVGFSAVVSLGSSSDIDFGEVLEYMISDPRTESIIMYVEGIRDARRFMSALRGAARVKPVLLIKVGRHPDVSRAIRSHSGSMSGNDAVFDAALRRAGVIRLYNMGQLFAAANALFSHFRPRGNRLAIVTNGGGPGVMAADRAADLGIPLSEFTEGTMEKLNASLPSGWSHGNPVDILGDADVERYRKTVQTVLEGPNVDGVLVMLTPQANTNPTAVAQAVVELEKNADKPVVTCWMGEELVREGRKAFEAAGIPTFRTPEPAVELFSHISAYYRNQKLLMQTPASLSHLNPPSVESARLVIETALAERRRVLNEMESKALLAAFRIPIAQTVIARSATEAMVLAEEIGLPVVMKIDSPSIIHKADSGGVRLNLGSLAAVRTAYQEILEEVRKNKPAAAINGVAIEPMILKRNGRELVVGVKRDAVFGPVITFGEGGNRVVANRDLEVALPPLNNYLVRDLIRSSRVSMLLGEFRTMPPVDMESLEFVLLRVSEMICELPWITELEINPLIIDENGAVAVDARVTVENVSPSVDRYAHMAIHPYPSQLITKWHYDAVEVTIRPIKPEDADLEVEFVRKLSAETKYYRFMNTMRELPPAMVARLTQIDYDREMAFLATIQEDGREIEIGVCRYAVNPDGESCEFAVVVADEWQHRGLARKLMGVLIETARNKGIMYMNGVFLANNERMLKFVQGLGFQLSNDPEDNTVKLGVLPLQD
ncbi:MAG: GNAT family N-acetyltransferase [Aromatoleum sp.]|jgi:acetyltransferase|uniref:bifunctional acetate--CoA ligase family protein/GNAT family N-acetyltransferase n=1 Tax=Aromatoleum sp. TaxID=2307007 RepID=UPI0028960FE0|nr:GNAT family N-acetyltransferase [Aromatoleum sp.]MDT3671185.1 GNAT family N-acetyltransferase [Aromatoleum sp.]